MIATCNVCTAKKRKAKSLLHANFGSVAVVFYSVCSLSTNWCYRKALQVTNMQCTLTAMIRSTNKMNNVPIFVFVLCSITCVHWWGGTHLERCMHIHDLCKRCKTTICFYDIIVIRPQKPFSGNKHTKIRNKSFLINVAKVQRNFVFCVRYCLTIYKWPINKCALHEI